MYGKRVEHAGGEPAVRRTEPARDTRNPGCAHGRLLDEVYGEDGQPTGRLACKECGAIVQDASAGRAPLPPCSLTE